MPAKTYEFKEFTIINNELSQSLQVNESACNDEAASLSKSARSSKTAPQDDLFRARKLLFLRMLCFGHTTFFSGTFKITDKQIADYFDAASPFEKIPLDEYYRILGLPPLYAEKVARLKDSGAFFSASYKIKVVWQSSTSSTVIDNYIDFNRIGLCLFDKAGECVGSISPNLFYIYQFIEENLAKWGTLSRPEKSATHHLLLKMAKTTTPPLIIPPSILNI